MKKYILITALIIFAALPVLAASGDLFMKRLKICSSYSYTYKTVNGKNLKRTITGTMPIPSGLGCFFSQEMEDGSKISCKFPVPRMREVVTAFSNGQEVEYFEKAIEDEICVEEKK